MPTKHLRRRRATPAGTWDQICFQKSPDTVDRLAFKYMEMCKVDSSSDSESDASPRWSDASSKSFQFHTVPKRSALPQKAFARYFPQVLDPYDGSSEDSSSSSADVPKRQKHGCFRTKCRGRRAAINPPSLLKEAKRAGHRDGTAFLYRSDVQMRSSSDSELNTFNLGDLFHCGSRKCASAGMSENIKHPLDLPATLFGTHSSVSLPYELPESSTPPGTLPKRKFLPMGDSEEHMLRKKQCVTQMETETIFFEG